MNDKINKDIEKNKNEDRVLEELENYRLNSIGESTMWFFIFFIINLLISYFCGFFEPDFETINSDLDYFFVFLGSGVFAYLFALGKGMASKNYKKFSTGYKKYFVNSVFEKLVDEVYYDVDNSVNVDKVFENIRNTGMLKIGNCIHNNDYIYGKYKGVSFEYSDFVTSIKYDDNDNVVLFSGQWLIFDFNKEFKFNFQVCEKNFSNSIIDDNLYKKVELEDIEFNNIFDVYAQNELEIFYILSPNTIERLKELNKIVNGSLLFCFVNNKLHIGLNNGEDFFEREITKEINVDQETKKIIDEIKIILNFVDILKLDNLLFKK